MFKAMKYIYKYTLKKNIMQGCFCFYTKKKYKFQEK